MTGLKIMHDELTTMANELPDYVPTSVSVSPYDTAGVYVPTWENCPPETEPLLRLNGRKILHRQNICMLTAPAGAGKTAVMHRSLVTIIQPEGMTLGLSAFAAGVDIIDTEHDARLFNILWQRWMMCCGLRRGDACPENVRWFNIRAVEGLEERKTFLWDRLESSMPLVIIDGIGDFVADPNDAEECTTLVYRLLAKAQEKDIGIFLSLHNNPTVANEKARGVLGSELWRKAESTLLIKKHADGIREVTTEYSLGKNRQDSDTLSSFFRWDDEESMHTPCDPPSQPRGKTVNTQQQVIDAMGNGRHPYTHLLSIIMDVAGVKRRAAAERIADMLAGGKIEKFPDGTYQVKNSDHWSDKI